MNHYLVKLNTVVALANVHDTIPYTTLVKATHSNKAMEIACREIELKVNINGVRSCTLVNNVDVSILKAYLEG